MKHFLQLTTKKLYKAICSSLIMFFLISCGIVEDDLLLITQKTGTFIDARNNREYKWIEIGNQTWMAENLAYLPTVNLTAPDSLDMPHYYVYEFNDINTVNAYANSNYILYGVLYDWKAAVNACPKGWHLPTDCEWKELEKSLGMTQKQVDDISRETRGTDQGTQMKTTFGWENNGNGTNISGFSGLPGGFRFANGNFCQVKNFGYWWTSTDASEEYAWSRGLSYKSKNILRDASFKENGFCIRCLLD